MKPNPRPNPPPLPPTAAPSAEGLWCAGELLVAAKGVYLPPVCIKTGEPIAKFIECKVSWNTGVQKASALLGPERLVRVALAAKRAVVFVGVSEMVLNARRRRKILAGVGCGIIFFSTMAYSFRTTEDPTRAFFGVFIALFLCAIWMAILLPGLNLLKPWKITDEVVFLKDIHPSVLQGLPEWPHRI